MQKVLVIVGPTAVGKSSLGIELAKRFNGEIISGDSVQIYRGFDIGSAKIKDVEKEDIIHHLIDIKDAKDNYSVKEFQENARELIDNISKRDKLPIIVGGTGLYIKACLYDYIFQEEKADDEPFDDLSNEDLYNRIYELDKDLLVKIHINNRKRLLRAYNAILKNGKKSLELAKQEHKLLYDAKIIGLTDDREILYQKADKRVIQMVEDGLIDEISSLLEKGSSFDDQAMQAIGYKEWKPYFLKLKNKDECIKDIQRNTHHFIKRQYTWFNNQMPIEWYKLDEVAKIELEVKKWLKIKN